jgi:ornithine decarboxylase
MPTNDDSAGLRFPSPCSAKVLAGLASRFGSPLLVIDCESVRRQYRALAQALPGV